MATQNTAFLPSTPLGPRPHVAFSSQLQTRASTRAAPRRLRRSTLCVAQEEKTHEGRTHDDDAQPKPVSIPATQSAEQRKERARKARIEAEKLELMAAKARLESERAELQAERKRLELDKVKNMKELNDSKNEQSPPDQIYPFSDSKQSNASTDSASSSSEPKLPSGFSSSSLSDLLGVDFPRVAEKDIDVIKEKICGMNTFFITEVDRSPFDERVVFRGNMRMDSDRLLDEMERLAKEEGIADRVRLFLLFDPKEGLDEDPDDKRPVLVALPASAAPNQTNTFSAVFSIIACLSATLTTLSYGVGIFGLTPDVITQIAKGSLEEVLLTLPVSTGAMVLAVLHDVGHRIAGQMRNVKLGLPFFIPSLQIGNYGTITPLESYPRYRKDLFDVAFAGPLFGVVGSVVALIAGLVITGSGEIADWFPQVPSALFHASLLVGSMADVILPAGLREQATIAVHPLTVIGYTGLLVNALNLMPIGRLDGGRIVQALYGRAVAGRATAITLLIQAVSSLVGNSPLLLFWGLVCVFLQRESDYPCQNEVIEPDSTRTALGIGALCVMLLVLIPFPDQIGDILGGY